VAASEPRAPEIPAPLSLVCANCHAELAGEYCASCGQRHEPHVHTVGHFASEALESISHADSRLWRTLWYLMARPGFLTQEFFRGRRARYLPPFRLYLVISVLFFLTLGMPEGASIEIDGEPGERAAALNQAAAGLEASGLRDPASKLTAERLREQARKEAEAERNGTTTEDQDKPEGLQRQNALTEFCKEFKDADPKGNKYYKSMRTMCAKADKDSGADLAQSVLHNIPRAMFVFLPLLALIMKLLYWRPKRYYVEHLLFLVHNHALVFLVLGTLALLGAIPVVGAHLGLVSAAAWIYMIWYMYRGMRNVYGQRRGRTVLKFFTLGFTYIIAAFATLLVTTIFVGMTYA
jgi:hypothetical protein